MRDLIVYEFVFVDEDGAKTTRDIWAGYETEAWSKADDIAYAEGYVDYYLKEDEQEKEKTMNNRVILTKELDDLFTDVVNSYLCKGFKLNTATMAGHQGEIAKIDLTDGTDVYRVVMDRTNESRIFSDKEAFWGDLIAITVERFAGKGGRNKRLRTGDVLWTGKGEEISVKTLYDISGRGEAWSEDRDYAKACEKKRYSTKHYDSNERIIMDISQNDRAFLRRLAKKTRGYGSVKLSQIESLVKVINPYSGSRSYKIRFTKDSGFRELTVKTA